LGLVKVYMNHCVEPQRSIQLRGYIYIYVCVCVCVEIFTVRIRYRYM